MATRNLREVTPVTSGVTDDTILFGAVGGVADADADPMTADAVYDYAADKMLTDARFAFYRGTSTDARTIGLGLVTFTTQQNLAFVAGNPVVASYDATNYMIGTCTYYAGTTLTMTVGSVVGSGTYAAWTLAITGFPGNGQNQWSGQQYYALATLTDAATIAWDATNAQKAKVTLGGNRTMGAVSNAVEGATYLLWIIQDGTGSRTLTWTTSGAGSFDFGTSGEPILTAAASKADLLSFEAISIGGTLKLRYAGIVRGFA